MYDFVFVTGAEKAAANPLTLCP